MEGAPSQKKYRTALGWFKLAAKQGNALAQMQMGFLYQNGLGVQQDLSEAIRWYRLAAAQGEEHAINNLEAMGINPQSGDSAGRSCTIDPETMRRDQGNR